MTRLSLQRAEYRAPSDPDRDTASRAPLCVDLDGTLVLSDLLFESFLLLIRQAPLAVFLVPIWLLRGKAVLKAEITARVVFCVRTLPYNDALIRWLQAERSSGRRLYLCTAANDALAASVAAHLQLFDGVLASDRRVNLSGSAKGAQLARQFGERGFDYCGNERCDIAVWKRANGAIVVNGHEALPQEVAGHVPVLRTFPRRPRVGLRLMLRALGLQHWLANGLVFVPLLATRRFDNGDRVVAALLAFLALCLCSSSIRIFCDLMNIDTDRGDPAGSRNPFDVGVLSIFNGLWLVPALSLGCLVSSWLLPWAFWLVLIAFAVFTAMYELARRVRVDARMLVVVALHASRLLAGALAVGLFI